MICPKCKAETRVVDSRPEPDGKVIKRRRACEGCGHRFPTFESTVDVSARRKADAAGQRARRLADPERAREQDRSHSERRRIRKMARAEATETGRPLAEILKQWEMGL
ncbi:hypothetical protein MFUR16E_04620 [Methylobacterium fujisawaense]|uniref:NrdR family transcriptional regulator n=1 Tax=Methylobacterium fujisawaense TaxID=107400 RepID=UPI002F329537